MTDLYMTAEQAASTLNISVKSLYAYVSRKKIRTKFTNESRKRFYWAEDIQRLARGEALAVADSALVPLTRITLLGDRGPVYRGRAALDLARTETIEQVAAHLWEVDANVAFTSAPASMPIGFTDARRAVSHLGVSAQAISLLPLIEDSFSRSFDLSKEGFARNGGEIMRWYAALMTGADRPSERPIHEQIAALVPDGDRYADLIRQVLVLAADHELTPATYAVRAAANTGITAWQAVTVGLIASQGRRLTGGRNILVRRLVSEIGAASEPEAMIGARFRDDEPLPGFGDGVYPEDDPRSEAVLALLERDFSELPIVERFSRAVRTTKEVYGKQPDFIVPLAVVEQVLGLHHNDGSLAILGRLAGWIAHASEQVSETQMMRVRTAYLGA